MSDEKLRELERRWRETKTVEDEAAYLRERVRVGDLSQPCVDMAARLGDLAARMLGQDRPTLAIDCEAKSLDLALSLALMRVALEAVEAQGKNYSFARTVFQAALRHWTGIEPIEDPNRLLVPLEGYAFPPDRQSRTLSESDRLAWVGVLAMRNLLLHLLAEDWGDRDSLNYRLEQVQRAFSGAAEFKSAVEEFVPSQCLAWLNGPRR